MSFTTYNLFEERPFKPILNCAVNRFLIPNLFKQISSFIFPYFHFLIIN